MRNHRCFGIGRLSPHLGRTADGDSTKRHHGWRARFSSRQCKERNSRLWRSSNGESHSWQWSYNQSDSALGSDVQGHPDEAISDGRQPPSSSSSRRERRLTLSGKWSRLSSTRPTGQAGKQRYGLRVWNNPTKGRRQLLIYPSSMECRRNRW